MKGFFDAVTLHTSRRPLELLPKCGKCGLWKGCESPKMIPSGKGNRNILIVGEAPGEDEDNKGFQFVGRTGQELKAVLQEVEVKMRRDCYLTNAAICRPPNNKLDNKVIDYCRPNLLKTLDELKPEVILLLGTKAVKSLIGHFWKEDPGGIKKWAGLQIPCQKLNAWICPTFHPSYVLREDNSVLDRHFKKHLAAMASLEGRPWDKVPDYKSEIELIFDQDKAAKAIYQFCKSKRPVAMDYETTMLKPDSPKSEIVCCSLSDGRRTISFVWGRQSARAMRSFVRRRLITKITANHQFEDRWTRRILGTEIKGDFWDVVVNAHLIDTRGGITSVKFQAFSLLGQEGYDDHIRPYLKTTGGGYVMNRIRELDIEELMVYNGMDSLVEWHIAKKQKEKLNAARKRKAS